MGVGFFISLVNKKSSEMMVKVQELFFVLLLMLSFSDEYECQFYCPGFIINSNCGDTEASEWNTKNIGLNLKEWIKSVQTVTLSSDSHRQRSKIKYKLTRDYHTSMLLHLSAIDCKTKQNLGKTWKIAGKTKEKGDHQFNNGFFYFMSNIKDYVVYLYPDMETALVGKFQNGNMVTAKESSIIKERCNHGMKEIEVKKPYPGSPIYKYTARSPTSIGDHPTLMDPYERKNVYVEKGIKDDGLFARRDIDKYDLVAYYSGMLINASNKSVRHCSFSQSAEFRWECNRNLIYLPPPSRNEMYIDVPKSYWSIAKYRATLGHKINHSFKYANSRYGMAYHPRYGSIRAVYATRHITRGEEILVNYGFKQGLEVPKWYATLYQTELGKQCYNGTLCS